MGIYWSKLQTPAKRFDELNKVHSTDGKMIAEMIQKSADNNPNKVTQLDVWLPSHTNIERVRNIIFKIPQVIAPTRSSWVVEGWSCQKINIQYKQRSWFHKI
jgi:hypothetical protein